ncbi:folate biopterin transporter subfamily protein [Cystoisospora suis]|uniref:Folate biopterin transporter subfamily protein n=1 Tax=Cystoisospora suis TaxID=483139 RepID=A0A2C6KR58_9APIC|nr:folate biopterin transporter subfamily protein [Cystoisospora suis]
MYLLGDAIILSLINSLSHMPGVILTSRLCPRQMESTVYAILAGISNFGHTISTLLGLRIIKLADIRTTASEGSACDFTNLPFLILCVHCFLPMLSIPLAMVLLPNKKMNEALLPNDGEHDSDGRHRRQQLHRGSSSMSLRQPHEREDSTEDGEGEREKERTSRRRRRRGDGGGDFEMLKRRWSHGEEGREDDEERRTRVKGGEEEGIEMGGGQMKMMDSDKMKKKKMKEGSPRMRTREGTRHVSHFQSNAEWKRIHDEEEGEEEEEDEESQHDDGDEVYVHRNKRSRRGRHHRAIDMDVEEEYLFNSSDHFLHRQHIDEGNVYKKIESSSSPTNQCMVYKPPHSQRSEEEEERREDKKEEDEKRKKNHSATSHHKDATAVMVGMKVSPDGIKEEEKKSTRKKKKREYKRSDKGEKSNGVELMTSRVPSFYSLASSSSSLSSHAPQGKSRHRGSFTYEVLGQAVEGGEEDEKEDENRRARRFQRDAPLLMHAALSSPRGNGRKEEQIGKRRGIVEEKDQSTLFQEERRKKERRRKRRKERYNREEDREERASSSSFDSSPSSSSHVERGSLCSFSSSEVEEFQDLFRKDGAESPRALSPSESKRNKTRHGRLISMSPFRKKESDHKTMKNNPVSLHPSRDDLTKGRSSPSSSLYQVETSLREEEACERDRKGHRYHSDGRREMSSSSEKERNTGEETSTVRSLFRTDRYSSSCPVEERSSYPFPSFDHSSYVHHAKEEEESISPSPSSTIQHLRSASSSSPSASYVFPSPSSSSSFSQGRGHLLSRSFQERSTASRGRHELRQCPDGEGPRTSCRSSRHELATSHGGGHTSSPSSSFPEEGGRCKTRERKEEEEGKTRMREKKREAKRSTEKKKKKDIFIRRLHLLPP